MNRYLIIKGGNKMENSSRKRKETGITIIALVITIVILIILSTVVINMAFGDNGLVKYAEQAKDMTEESSKLEEINLKVTEYKMKKHTEGETRTLSEYLKDELNLDSIRENKYGTILFKIRK